MAWAVRRGDQRGGALDLVITNVIVIDPVLGIVKADIGIKDGRIVGIGKAGNPSTMDGVHPRLVVGAGTEIIAGEHLIATPGGIDTHIHMISPQQVYDALSNGITTHARRRHRPGRRHERHDLHAGPVEHRAHAGAAESLPVNWGSGQRQRLGRRAAGRADRGRGLRAQGPRGLGHHARGDRRLPARRRRVRRADRHPHRHAERGRLRRRHHHARSTGARSTPITPRARAAATRRTSSRSPASRTSCLPRPTRRGPTPSTRSPSTWTC